MIFTDKKFIRFLVVFATVFLLCYYGALFITGIAVPGGSYSPFVAKYLDVTAWLRSSLILSAKFLLGLFGTETYRADAYVLRAVSGRGIRIVYACLGFGVMSFWVAYVAATMAGVRKKVWWLFGGLLLIWGINVIRLSLVLEAAVKGWKFPFGWDHHTWFNIIAYVAIFGMMYFFEGSLRGGAKSIKKEKRLIAEE